MEIFSIIIDYYQKIKGIIGKGGIPKDYRLPLCFSTVLSNSYLLLLWKLLWTPCYRTLTSPFSAPFSCFENSGWGKEG
jgi:hypothetical protein